MAFKKFGTSDDQKVLADEKDTQGVRKEAAHKDQSREEILRELARENVDDE